MGEKLASMGMDISSMTCSAQKRAILSGKYFREGYEKISGKKLDIKLLLKSHEIKGCYEKQKTFPGLNKKQIKSIIDDIIIDEENEVDEEEGWFKKDTIETDEEMLERVKDLIRYYKDLHNQNPDQTILSIAHGMTLRYLMAIITNQMNLLPKIVLGP